MRKISRAATDNIADIRHLFIRHPARYGATARHPQRGIAGTCGKVRVRQHRQPAQREEHYRLLQKPAAQGGHRKAPTYRRFSGEEGLVREDILHFPVFFPTFGTKF